MANRLLQINIRAKLFILVLCAFTLLIVVTSWQIGRQATETSTESIKRSLKQASVVLDTKIESRFDAIDEIAVGIAKDGRVLPLVFDLESATLQDLSYEFESVLEFDILFFTAADGEILARSDRPEAIGFNMAGKSQLFDNALAGIPARGFLVSQGKPMQIVVHPIYDNVAKDVIRGTVALAYELSAEIAREINALTASDISFAIFTRDDNREINGARTTYNTNDQLGAKLDEYFSENPSAWQALIEGQERFRDLKISFSNEEYYSVIHVLSNDDRRPLGFVITLRSRNELMEPFIEIQKSVFIIGVLCLLVASVFAWVFAQRISKPIITLANMTTRIQEGKYLDTLDANKAPKRHDEIGLLYQAFTRMGKALQEKAELENYLAQMSDELDTSSAVAFASQSGSTENSTSDAAKDTEDTAPDEDKTLVHMSSGSISSEKPQGNDEIVEDIDERYAIIRRLGAGAFGTVFLAQDRALDEKVAIKMMPRDLFNKQQTINFKEEIRLARQITHRNIIRTFDFGQWQDYYYITMEYVLGYDLGALLKNKGAFNTHIGLIMAKQICSAMNAAHEQGIIHRDLKPANMMINRQGILKIMDFGLAMKVQENISNNNSATNLIAGTPRYMAPEQFFNWNLDERTDIYSIGIILYALFTGTPPFTAKDSETLGHMHLKKAPKPLSEHVNNMPKDLEWLILKALAKEPKDRFQSVREMIDALNAVVC